MDSGIGAVLDGKNVSRISAFLVDGDVDRSPAKLSENPYISQGSQIYGKGFVFDDGDRSSTSIQVMREILSEHPSMKSRIKPFIGGDEINSKPDHSAHRYVIYLSDLSDEEELSDFDPLAEIIRDKVYPERMKLRDTNSGRQLKKKWWA